MIRLTPTLTINETQIKYHFIKSPGPGGQNVNNVQTGVCLRFNVVDAQLINDETKIRIIQSLGNKLTSQGDIVIKAYRFRTQNRNKEDALNRLLEMLKAASFVPKKRKKTKPTYTSTQKRLQTKKKHSQKKITRSKFHDTE